MGALCSSKGSPIPLYGEHLSGGKKKLDYHIDVDGGQKQYRFINGA